jgi:glycine C-acetyltransferase
LDLIRTRPELRENLWKVVNALQAGLKAKGFNTGGTESPVTPVILEGGIPEATHLTYDLRENYNVFCSIVTYPVVPKGVILLRLIPTAVHTLEDVKCTIEAFSVIKRKLDAGEYPKDKMVDAATFMKAPVA